MARGGFRGGPMGGGGNMQQMLKQAQKMQETVMKIQQETESKEVEASSGGGVVTVKANGKKEVLEIKIKPEAVDPDDVEMLEDLVLAAVNEAISQADKMMSEAMGKAGLPGGLM